MIFDSEINNVFFPYKILTYPDILAKLINGEEVSPINLEINLTNCCNHNCIWCTYGYLHGTGDSLDTDRVKELLDSAREMGVQSVTWTGGGEPTVHKDFPKLIRYAASIGFKQGLNTNGRLLTQDTIAFIAETFSYIRFSVDAGCSETLQKCHRAAPEDFEIIISNLRNLCRCKKIRKEGPVIGFSFLIDSTNYYDMVRAAEIAKDAGVDYIQYKPIVHYGSNAQFAGDAPIWTEMEKAFRQVKALETSGFAVHILDHKFKNIQLEKENYGRKYTKCLGCNLFASVGANGSVDLCCAYKGRPQWSAGNINDQKFEQIWFGEKRKKLRDSVEISQCPPMCKADETNRMIYFLSNFNANREFI